MKHKLLLKNTETLVTELIIKSDDIKSLINYVRDNSIYKDNYAYGFPLYMITLYNNVRKEIVIGNNEVSGINFMEQFVLEIIMSMTMSYKLFM